MLVTFMQVVGTFNGLSHPIDEDVIQWKHFPHYCPFVNGIHQLPIESHFKGPVMRHYDDFVLFPA